MQVIEKLSGKGSVQVEDEVLLTHVPYRLTLWREAGRTDERLDGRLEISMEMAQQLMEYPMLLTLHLENGRSVYFRLTATTGRITSENQ